MQIKLQKWSLACRRTVVARDIDHRAKGRGQGLKRPFHVFELVRGIPGEEKDIVPASSMGACE